MTLFVEDCLEFPVYSHVCCGVLNGGFSGRCLLHMGYQV